jgi:membrane protease YdiL (CAAX protease family)
MTYFFILIPLLANMLIDVWLNKKKYSDNSCIMQRHRARIFGIMAMVVGLFGLHQMGIVHIGVLTKSWSLNESTLVVSIVAGVIMLVASLFIISRQPNVNGSIRIQKLVNASKWYIGVVWMLYLICYESYFRILLLPMLPNVTGISIMLMNVMVYAALHIHRAKSEILAAIPFGFFICYCTLFSGSVWPAFVAHAVLAWITHLGLWPIYNRFHFSNVILFTHAQKQTS